MKVTQRLLALKTRPSKPGNAGIFPVSTRLRAGRKLSGAFLFVAFMAFVIYGSAPAVKNANANAANIDQGGGAQATQSTSLSSDATTNQPGSGADTPSDAGSGSNGSGGTNLNTQVTTDNGSTNVTVNGQSVKPSADGSINKTINTADGTVQINVSQSTSGSSSTNTQSSVNYSGNDNQPSSSDVSPDTGVWMYNPDN